MTLKQDLSINSMVNLMNRNIIRLNIFIQTKRMKEHRTTEEEMEGPNSS